MASAQRFVKRPLFRLQYYEYDDKIGFPVELYKYPIIIDGVFEPHTKNNRLSLGYFVNLRRKEETADALVKLGLGLHFGIDEANNFMTRSFSRFPIYVYYRREQYKLELGDIMVFYDLTPVFEHKILPKKVGRIYEEYGMRISFGHPFKKQQNDELSAPCWIEMALNRIVDSTE